jgi:hypothetical protein
MSNIRTLLNSFRTYNGPEAGDGGDGDTVGGGNPLDPLGGPPPTIARVFGGLVGNFSSSTLIPALPSGAAGQLMVACFGFRGNEPIITPSGWTEVGSYEPVLGTGVGGATGAYMAYRVRQAGDTAPTFSRAFGGYEWNGGIVGYTKSSGANVNVLDVSSERGTTTGEPTVFGNPLTTTGQNRLIVAVSSIPYFITTADNSFAGANVLASAPPGSLVPLVANVSSTQWGHTFFAATDGTDKNTAWSFDLYWTDSGDTGQFVHNMPGPNARSAMIVAAFKEP